MSSHNDLLQMMKANLEKMTPEQRAAHEQEQKTKVHAVNKLPTWLQVGEKNILVTGANTGIGFETVRGLVKLGNDKVHVFMGVRDQKKGDEAAAKIKQEFPFARVEVVIVDVSSVAKVKQFVTSFRERNIDLDVLINNAGIMATPFSLTSEGVEAQFATNHLGHFYLTTRLLDKIRPGGRILNLSSGAHYRAPAFNFDILAKLEEKDYEPWRQYSYTKACNVLFTIELQKRLDAQGKNITVAAVHPGFVRTELQERIGLSCDEFYEATGMIPLSPQRGAENSLYTALCPGIPAGKYWDNTEVKASNPVTMDENNQRQLWDLSEKLIAEIVGN